MNALLDDFLTRFGDEEAQEFTSKPKPKVKTVSTLKSNTDVIAMSDAKGLLDQSASKASKGLAVDNIDVPKGAGLAGAANSAMGLLEAAPAVMGVIDNFKGGQFNTSAEGPGVGKRDGAVLQGASQGAKAGQAIGSLAGPVGGAIGTGVGAIGGAVSSWVGHDKASKEYRENRRKFNKKGEAVQRAENAETYTMAEGLASVEGLKELRKKQLGLIS